MLPTFALYIHWPFCKKKCPYCDFNSHVRAEVNHARYRAALLSELRTMHQLMPEYRLGSIFFGGGTPSLMLPDTAANLIDEACRLWTYHEDIEITLEANPTSVEAETFPAFKQAGINRVSLGIQSLDDQELAFLGREHSAHEALHALEYAQQTFTRFNFDLIYALPGHTPDQWEISLRTALTYAGGHLSLYQLTIEPNTAFHTAYFGKRAFALPEEEQAARLYEITQSVMDEAGLPAYEISNHACVGEESRHNLSYWRSDPYIGIGPGAHGRMMLEKESICHATQTFKTPERWLDAVERGGHGIEEITAVSATERMEEKLLMGLRLSEGFPLARLNAEEHVALKQQLDPACLIAMSDAGLLQITDTHWHATAQGKLVLNSLLATLLT
jgi:putative oxygen-independent coproporphyrinogen III oxidase